MNETPQVQENLGTIPAGDEHFSDASVAMPCCGSDGGVACRGLHAPNKCQPSMVAAETGAVQHHDISCAQNAGLLQ